LFYIDFEPKYHEHIKGFARGFEVNYIGQGMIWAALGKQKVAVGVNTWAWKALQKTFGETPGIYKWPTIKERAFGDFGFDAYRFGSKRD
jgi:hypothetical protein